MSMSFRGLRDSTNLYSDELINIQVCGINKNKDMLNGKRLLDGNYMKLNA